MDASRIAIRGPLASHVPGLWSTLAGRGYTPLSIANVARLMAHLSRWLARERLTPADLTSHQIGRFLRHRKHARYTCWLSTRGVEPILAYLRTVGIGPPAEHPARVPTGHDAIVDRYREYLQRERALTPSTAAFYERIARAFLPRDGDLRSLNAASVTAFVLEASRTYSVAYTKYKVSALRCLLRYLYVQGDLAANRAAAVPAVAGWHLASLPRDAPPDAVRQLLRSCPRRTPIGRRARAAVLLMVRLGLRAGEVAALQLEDLHWGAGEVLIRGKGRSLDRLPLPADVGAALAAYVRGSRSRATTTRRVFLRVRAPHGALSSGGLKSLLCATCHRAGLPAMGTHRLRHTAATQMLHHGASLTEIAQVLRHRHLDTTAIYAKVDRRALRQLAHPWPGGAR
jgi:integrase/recombinase XerD